MFDLDKFIQYNDKFELSNNSSERNEKNILNDNLTYFNINYYNYILERENEQKDNDKNQVNTEVNNDLVQYDITNDSSIKKGKMKQ